MKPIRRFSKRRIIIISVIIILGYLFVPRPWANDDIRSDMFRYLMKHNGSEIGPYASAYFLALGRSSDKTDPSRLVLLRFSRQKPQVLPISQAVYKNRYSPPTDAKTGKRGTILFVGKITWVWPNMVHVQAGYFEGGLSASDGTYTMLYLGGKWVVMGVSNHGMA